MNTTDIANQIVAARRNKDYATADSLRDEMVAKGYMVNIKGDEVTICEEWETAKWQENYAKRMVLEGQAVRRRIEREKRESRA